LSLQAGWLQAQSAAAVAALAAAELECLFAALPRLALPVKSPEPAGGSA
jgi:hypothetical protein